MENMDKLYAEYLMGEMGFTPEYSIEWFNGGTYGTCWDENGPSEVVPEEPLTYKDFDVYYEILGKFFSDPKSVETEFLHCLTQDEYSENDYYGGVEYIGTLTFNSIELIDAILQNKYNTKPNLTLSEAKDVLPELFLQETK